MFQIETFILILLLTTMEIDTFFFCKDIELLNSTMYIFSILSFPTDCTNYLRYIASVAHGNVNSSKLRRIGKFMVGINSAYSDGMEYDVYTSNRSGNIGHKTIVDLTNSNVIFN